MAAKFAAVNALAAVASMDLSPPREGIRHQIQGSRFRDTVRKSQDAPLSLSARVLGVSPLEEQLAGRHRGEARHADSAPVALVADCGHFASSYLSVLL
jgi:hypothetical protein